MSPITTKVPIDSKPEPAHHSSSPTVQRLKKKPTVQRLHKKSRKPTDTKVTDLRKIVKNTTRQRFFNECLKERSSLWYLTPGGKQAMNRLLFERAVKEVLDKLYEENPGPLRAVKSQELKQCVHWQVMRDRNNWMGKEPKRASFYGTMSMFDFEAEKELIDKALSTAEDLTADAVVVKTEDTVVTKDAVVVKSENKCDARAAEDKCNARGVKDDCDARAVVSQPKDKCDDARAVVTPTTLKNCLKCGALVWIGKVEDCPPSAEIAFPLGSSWGTYNVEPYCENCWRDESTFLQNLGGQYRAVGKKRKRADLIHKVVSKANDDAILRATSLHATTPPPRKKKTSQKKKITKKAKSSKKKKFVYKTPQKKKRLGGWRGPLPRNAKKENIQRWQVCTVVHNVLLSKSSN